VAQDRVEAQGGEIDALELAALGAKAVRVATGESIVEGPIVGVSEEQNGASHGPTMRHASSRD
jgi:hypothetical protein